MRIITTNPATGKPLAEYEAHPSKEIKARIETAHNTWREWRHTQYSERADRMRRAAGVLRERTDEFGRLMAQEMGKPVTQARAEVEKCAWVCDYYADNAQHFLESEVVETDAMKSYVAYRPLGTILAVMPWNFPFWQVFRFAAPALMAGNAGLLKHASNVPGCALAIEDVFRQAGFPDGLFATLLISSREVDGVLADPRVRAATLTGSTRAGQAVAAAAGRQLKKTVLELGGSDAYLILHDADLDHAVKTCAYSRLINSGQSCIAAKRFIVVDSIKERFEKELAEEMKSYKMGDPLSDDTKVGPLAREDLRDELHEQVKASLNRGARCLVGGEVPPGKGYFYPPTVLTDVKPGSPAYDEELFGPVAAIIGAADDDEAIHIANDSVYGLGAAVFTSSISRGERIAANELDAGACFVNTFVRSDPRLPFGGVKESGYGRELGYHGIREFVNVKTVYVK